MLNPSDWDKYCFCVRPHPVSCDLDPDDLYPFAQYRFQLKGGQFDFNWKPNKVMTAMGRRGPLGASDKIMGQFLPHHHHGVPPHCPATAHHTSAVWCLTTQPPLGLALTLVPRYVLYPFCLAVLLVCLFAAFCRFLAKVLVATNTAARSSVVVARTPFGCGFHTTFTTSCTLVGILWIADSCGRGRRVVQCTDGGRSLQLMAAAPKSITWMDRVLQRH